MEKVDGRRGVNPGLLRKFPFFGSFSLDQLEEIAKTAHKTAFKANTVVFRQGERSKTMYLILKGGVKIERQDGNGELITIGELSENQVFGELAMLSEEPRHASVTTITSSEFMVIDRKMMLNVIRKSGAQEILEAFSVLIKQIWDASEREFHQELARRTLEAQMEVEKQHSLTQMVAGVAHEINTPLGIINTAVSIMARELAVPEEITIQRAADIAESLELIRRNVERAHELVQDFKKVSVGQLTAEKESLDISEVVSETIGLIMVSLKRNKVTIKFQDKLESGERLWIGYRRYLSQILINFLTNVERYAYPNNVGGVVDVILELNDKDRFRIIFRDHGKGISPEDLSRIFEPFFTTGRAMGGTGLGLAIVHNLVVNALEGEIKVKSKPGRGTEFRVTFPRKIPD